MGINTGVKQITAHFFGHQEIQHTDIAERFDTLLDSVCQQGFSFLVVELGLQEKGVSFLDTAES